MSGTVLNVLLVLFLSTLTTTLWNSLTFITLIFQALSSALSVGSSTNQALSKCLLSKAVNE